MRRIRAAIVFGLRRFPGQAFSLQSFVIFSKGFLLSLVFGGCFRSVASVLKSPSSLSLREVPARPIAHGHLQFSDQLDDDSRAMVCRKETC